MAAVTSKSKKVKKQTGSIIRAKVTRRKTVYNVKIKCKSNGGICKVRNCKKRGQCFKLLDKHLTRAHSDLTERQFRAMPDVACREASHMRYRIKEECGICGKTLLLRPHLKNAHKVGTWGEYIAKLKELKGKSKHQQWVAEEKATPTGGLNSLLKEISPGVAASKRPKRLPAQEPICSPEEAADSPLRSRQSGQLLYSEDEFLRFCVHNTNLYMVLATLHAMKDEKKDPGRVLNFLSKNKLSIEHCKYILDANFIRKLYGFYRFAGYYPYATEKCISCTSISRCSCDMLPRSFYTFCRRACNEAFFDCTVCKNWGSGYHVCEDFFWCEVCDTAAKRCPLQVADL